MSDAAPTPSVSSAVRQGFIWNLLNFLFSQGAGVAIFIILSRAVSPAVFGVFALAAILVDLFSMQGRWSAMDALIQRQDFSQKALSTAFFCLLGVCVLVLVVADIAAGWAAHLFAEPMLAHVLPALALSLIFLPPIVVMDALIMRRLQFRAQAIRSIIGTLLGGAAGLAVAFSPYIEWALVAQRLAATLVTLGVLFAYTRWVPALTFERESARTFLIRAGQLWGTTILVTASARIVEAFIGLRSGAEALGLVAVARRFETLVHGPVTGPIQGLWVPVLSVLRKDRAESWRLFLRLGQIASFIAVPVFAGLALLAPEFVAVVLDERYRAAGIILAVIAAQSLLIPTGYFANVVFSGLDRADLSLKFWIVSLAACIPVVWFASQYGPVAAILGSFAVMGAAGVTATIVQIRMLHGRVSEFLIAIVPGYSGAAAMALAVIALKLVMPADAALLKLIVAPLLGAAVFAGWIYCFHRTQVLETWRFLSEHRAPPRIDAQNG